MCGPKHLAGDSTYAIRARGITKRFGSVQALAGLDLSITAGSVFGLIGPNGAGKSTFMRILCDLIRPTAGSLNVLGESPQTGGAALRARIGYLPGELRLTPRARGTELIQMWAGLGPNRKRSLARARELLAFLDLDPTRRVGQLSKGNRQKLGITQAFMNDPALLILDEPTSGLDPILQEQFQQLVLEAKGRGATVLLSSHVLSEIERMADRAAVLSAGRVIREGRLTDLIAHADRHLRAVVAANADTVRTEATRQGLDLALTPFDGRVLVTGTVRGNVGAVLAFLAALPVEDFTFTEPDLGESVMEIYEANS